ncbi:MAG TPA: M4 family metallopeptidase [Vicinamibacterales bacterium]|nr:M4 family metallopeptidase [Vicinamibacterales bacterium]
MYFHAISRTALGLGAAVLAVLCFTPSATAQTRRAALSVSPQTAAQLREWDVRIERLLRSGELRMARRREDPLLEGRTHERASQYHRGVRVFGADVARQLDGGQLVSAFGRLYEGISIDVAPRLTAEDARAIVERRAGVVLGPSREPELVILPLEAGFRLVWRLRAATGSDIRQYFVDARDGAIALEYSDRKTQLPEGTVGTARGVLGDQKKISVSPNAAGFVTSDQLRPPSLRTYDMRGDWQRVINYLNGVISLSPGDLGADTDNDWTDGAVGDAHVYTGWTYDYFFKRFNRRGLDDQNIAIVSLAHPARRIEIFELFDTIPDFYLNAFYAGDGVMVYGVGLPGGITVGGQAVDFFSGALDIVAHELTHGVTDYTSGLIYENESGALNEAFSDIMATGVEFYFQRTGSGSMEADYLIGEDVIRPGGIRSMSNPASFGDPDHYSRRFTGDDDNGGVHINSSIPNHAFYLAIEGGTNRTSGASVTGVGAANREQIERVFYRAFTQMLPSGATFSLARAATLQAARDLYGGGSPAERAVQQAWSAVGVE